MTPYEQAALWQRAFSHAGDGFNAQRDLLVEAYRAFRDRVSKLLQLIATELPALTVHDITHVDALWHVASEIAGPDYPLNPAEAFVLGGAFLLHDAAHCRAAFSGGLEEIRSLPEWRDAATQYGISPENIVAGTEDFQTVLFDVLRQLHPKRARSLAEASWEAPGDPTPLKLLPHDELRQAYGAVIGEIAESHWLSPHALESLVRRSLPPPTILRGTGWDVDILKVALLLRTADAAHIDADRAPRFLFALVKPAGLSREHWAFQSKLHPGRCDPRTNELRIAGGPFHANEQNAWWLAYDNCRMVDRELEAADELLRDAHRQRFLARSVEGAHHPEWFARNVTVEGWHPVDASVRITDISRVVEQFGGRQLYGDKPHLALRELLQNARDAVVACRAMGGLGNTDGHIEVEMECRDGEHWLHVTDTGIGMSRYVLTRVLLDFGRSLWRDQSVRDEWPGLASSGFEAVGQFGIGFFSVFMLGEKVKVVTRRFEKSGEDDQSQWVLEFFRSTSARPMLRIPTSAERLKRHGTRVSVQLKNRTDLLTVKKHMLDIFSGMTKSTSTPLLLRDLVGILAPALEVDAYVREGDGISTKVISAGDWRNMSPVALLERIAPWLQENRTGLLGQGAFERSAELLASLNSEHGECLGRCAVTNPTLSFFAVSVGVVTVGGLWGGEIHGFHGLLVGRPQDRLDRSSAVPAAPLEAISDWANGQARQLIEKSQLTPGLSRILLALGADPEELLVVALGSRSLTTRQFREKLAGLDEIWLLSETDSSYDSDDDVLKHEFENNLVFDSRVLIVNLTKSRNQFVIAEVWPPENSPGSRCPAEVVERVVNEVWPNAVSDEEQERAIGNVLGVSIMRNVTVVQRTRSE